MSGVLDSAAAFSRSLARRPMDRILKRNSEAINPEARCRAGRPCLEASKSRDRLSGLPTWPVVFVASLGRRGFHARATLSVLDLENTRSTQDRSDGDARRLMHQRRAPHAAKAWRSLRSWPRWWDLRS